MAIEHRHGGMHELFHWVLDYWHVSGLILGGLIGGLWWALHQIFTTHAVMDQCKIDLVKTMEKNIAESDKRFKEFNERNDRDHKKIGDSVDWIKNYLIKKGDE